MFGRSRLHELREGVHRYVSGFDPALVCGDDAVVVLDDAVAIEKMAATLKALAAARVAETGHWRRRGARSPAHDLAERSGTSVGAAGDALAAAKRMGELPVLAGAARRGELSGPQVAAIADAAAADPGAEARLVNSSKHSSLGELRDECARTKAAARPREAEARHAEVHRNRFLRHFTDREGGWNLSVRNVPEVGAELMAMLRPLQDRIFRRARAEGRRESFEAYGADALAEMVRMAAGAGTAAGRSGAEADDRPDLVAAGAEGRAAADSGADEAVRGDADDADHTDEADDAVQDNAGTLFDLETEATGADDAAGAGVAVTVPGGGAVAAGDDSPGPAGGAAVAERPGRTPAPRRSVMPAKIIFRLDWDAFVRGFPIDGEVCEIAGIGPVPVSVVRALLETGDPFLAAVVTKGVDVANVAHLGRRATAHQVTALQWRDPVCPALGCNNTCDLEIDHRENWATTKITLLELLDRPCKHHHHLKTREGWAFVAGVGKRPMVPPDDPRHPKYQERAGPASGPEPGQPTEPESDSAHGDPPRAA